MVNEDATENQTDGQTSLPDVAKLWSDLLDDVLDPSQRLRLLNQVTSDLKTEVTRRPDAAALLSTLHQIFQERPLTEDMWPNAERALLLAYGPAAARLIRWLITEADDIANRLDEISPMLDTGTEALLRDILTRHSEDLSWSYFAWSYSADEWRTLNFITRQSLDGRNYYSDVGLIKVNGEQLNFRVRANQLLIITRGFLQAINDHPSIAFTSTELVEYFLEAARTSVNTLSALTEVPQGNGSASATDEQTPEGSSRSPVDDEDRG